MTFLPRVALKPFSLHPLGRVLLFWLGYVVVLLTMSQIKVLVPAQWGQLAWGLSSSAALLALSMLFLRLEGRTVRDIGLDFAGMSLVRFASGTLIGWVIFALVILLLSIFAGPLNVAWNASLQPALLFGSACTFVALACMEELGFRGYPLRTLIPSLGPWPAQGIVIIAFALSHVAYGWPASSIMLGVVPAAFLFGMAAIASRGLAMPIGVHAGLNMAESAVGEDQAYRIWTLVMDEPVREQVAVLAPLISPAVVILAGLAFWFWHRSRQRDGVAPNNQPGI